MKTEIPDFQRTHVSTLFSLLNKYYRTADFQETYLRVISNILCVSSVYLLQIGN